MQARGATDRPSGGGRQLRNEGPASGGTSPSPRSILDVMTGPFAAFFPMPTWRPWYLLAAAAFGLTHGLSAEDEAFILKCLGRKELPREPATGLRLVIGRRGGKSRFTSFLAVFLAAFRDYTNMLAPGERGTVMVICPDRKQARVVLGHIAAFLEHPMLAGLVASRTQEGLHLTNGVSIEVHSKSYRTVRGYTIVAFILDEAAMLPTDDSAEPDTELIAALEPAMLTVPGAIGMLIGSPHARRGAFWKDYRQHYYGVDGDPVLVWQADTRTMNPSVSAAYIAKAYAEDDVIARSEFGAQFRSDLEAFISREVLESVTVPDRRELPPTSGVEYAAFVDPSGGAADSMTLAIAHRDRVGKIAARRRA